MDATLSRESCGFVGVGALDTACAAHTAQANTTNEQQSRRNGTLIPWEKPRSQANFPCSVHKRKRHPEINSGTLQKELQMVKHSIFKHKCLAWVCGFWCGWPSNLKDGPHHQILLMPNIPTSFLPLSPCLVKPAAIPLRTLTRTMHLPLDHRQGSECLGFFLRQQASPWSTREHPAAHDDSTLASSSSSSSIMSFYPVSSEEQGEKYYQASSVSSSEREGPDYVSPLSLPSLEVRSSVQARQAQAGISITRTDMQLDSFTHLLHHVPLFPSTPTPHPVRSMQVE